MMAETDGWAEVCFSADESWFQGHLVTDDDCQFILTGRQTNENEKCGDEPGVFRITLHDHDQFIDYTLDQVVRTSKHPNCWLVSKQIDFKSTSCFRGQKADLIIQTILPAHVGKKMHVYVGPMKINLITDQTPLSPWSM